MGKKRWKKGLLGMVVALMFMASASMSWATTIEYTATDNGLGNYTLVYEVTNDTLSDDIAWLSIFFGQTTDGLNFNNYDQFSNFSPDYDGDGTEPQPTGWFSYSFEPSPAIDLPGQFNSDVVIGSGIGTGTSLGGFTVSFDWTGVGSYDDLYYEVGTSSTIDTGYTVQSGGPAPVPEPATILLVSAGLAGIGFLRRKKVLE